MDGARGALWLPSYLRRDATALGLLLLSMFMVISYKPHINKFAPV
jgi:hypothetical protein